MYLLLNISICCWIILNAQNAILWHEHTPRDVSATRSLRHRWHFVKSLKAIRQTLLQFIDVMNLMSVANVCPCMHSPQRLKSTKTIKFVWLILSTIKQNGDIVLTYVHQNIGYLWYYTFHKVGSVAKRCRSGGKWHEPRGKFTAESNNRNILKINQRLSQLRTNIKWHVFYGPRCIYSVSKK